MSVFEAISYYFKVYQKFIGRRLYLVFVLTAGAALTESFGITLLLPLIEAADAGGAGGNMSSTAATLNRFLDFIGIGDSLVGILLFIGVVFIGKGALHFAEGGYVSYLQSQLMQEIRGQMFDAYSNMDYGHYSKRNTGHFINIINNQITNFITSFSTFKRFLASIIVTLSYIIFAFILAWKFALMAVVVGCGLLFLFRWLNNFVKKLSIKTANEYSSLNKFLVQSLQSFKYLASTAQISHLRTGIFGSIKKLATYVFKRGASKAFTLAIREPISVIFLLFIIIIQVAVFEDPIAPIFVALLLFHRGMQQIITIQNEWLNTMDNIGSLEMVVEEFKVVEDHQEPTGPIKINQLSKGIEFSNVQFAYDQKEEDVLRDINLEISVNQTVAFVGESGAGKSTLIDMITLMLRPREGEIFIDNVKGSDIERHSWRSQIGYVSQETVIFDDTIANNICLWRGDYQSDPEIREQIRDAAKKAYALEFIDDLPEGFNTVVGDRGVRLSGGQRQRVFIARELFKKPSLLILDEATSALDSESESFIQKSIDDLKGSMTVVIIAHRLSTIRNVDYIYVLDKGRIVEHGSYDELTLVENGHFKEMVEMQSL